jgi:twinkle protein
MTPYQLNQMLCDRIESVCAYLLPCGKKSGAEWVCGDLDGNKGKSTKVHLSGNKIGVWADFADSSNVGGDLIDLWMRVRNLTIHEAMNEISAWLGVREDGVNSRPRREYRRPEKPSGFKMVSSAPKGLEYLKGRGITEKTLIDFKICANDDEIAFPYLRDGVLLNMKYMKIDRQDGKKVCRQERESEPSLFGWQAVCQNSRQVVICEGEIDAMTVRQWGFDALSIPNGANGGHGLDWIEEEYENLKRFDTLYLCTDMDVPGQRVLSEMARRLGIERCKIVELPHKDPNECLANGMTANDFERCLLLARTQDPSELKPANAFTDEVSRCFFPDGSGSLGVATPFKKVNDQGFYFEQGGVTVWSGWSGSGKSAMTGYFALSGMAEGSRWCIASMEMLPARTLTRMIRQHTGQQEPDRESIVESLRWMGERLWLVDIVGTAKLARLLEVFRYAAKRYGITQFVVDSLAKFDLAEEDYTGQKELVNVLGGFAHEHNSHVHLVAHPRKGINEDRPPGKLDVRGGAAITDLVSNVVVVYRNRQQSKEPGDPDGAFIVQKRRLDDGAEGWTNLWFDKASLRYSDSRPSAKN